MTKKLLLATSNRGKIKELKGLLSASFACVAPEDVAFGALQAPEVIEDGANYCENALKKASAYAEIFHLPILADDSGLEVDALDGEPGLYSARFGGEQISWEERRALLISRLSHIPPEKWTARFRAVICYFEAGVPHFFEGIAEGRLIPQGRGDQGFGYDPIFLSDDLKKTFAEASAHEKSLVSHRGRAIQEFLAFTTP